METERPVLPERSPSIVIEAWRCEHCRKFYPVSLPATVVVVDDIGGSSFSGGVTSKGRIARRMVVCPPCKRQITGG